MQSTAAARHDRKVKDSYEVRKREGRPNHGTTSITILAVGSIAWILQASAIGLPRWRSQSIGTLGYARPRHWGLFVVSGARVQWHHSLLEDTCAYSGGLHVGGICLSPICNWYKVKCHVYRDIRDLGYIVGAVFIVELALHTLCMVWTVKLQPNTITRAGYCWLIVVLTHLGAIITYGLMSDDPFDELGQHAFYPDPQFGISFISSAVALVLLIANAILGRSLAAMWPDPDAEETSSSSEEDSSDEGDNEFLKAGAKKKPKQGALPGQPRPGQPGQQMPVQPVRGQPLPGQPTPGQPMQQGTQPGQPMQQTPMPSGVGPPPQAFGSQPSWQAQQHGTGMLQEQTPFAAAPYGQPPGQAQNGRDMPQGFSGGQAYGRPA